MGAGVLGLPYALRRGGWAVSLVIVCSSVVASYTAKMLVWSFNTLNERKRATDDVGKGFVVTYDQLSEEVGGALAGKLMKALTILECYGCAVCYVVLHATNWPQILNLPPLFFDFIPAPVLSVSVWALLMMPLILIKTRHLAAFGSLGVVAMSMLCFVSIAAPALNGEPTGPEVSCVVLDSSTSDDEVAGQREVVVPESLGVSLGLVLFCFGGHATLPDIYARMTLEQRPHFDKAINVGTSMAAALYVLLGSVRHAPCTSSCSL